VPADQGGEGRRVPVGEEAFQQLPVGQTSPVPQQHSPAEVLEDFAQLACHSMTLKGTGLPLPFYYPVGPGRMRRFF
jgi:hypothetical protein